MFKYCSYEMFICNTLPKAINWLTKLYNNYIKTNKKPKNLSTIITNSRCSSTIHSIGDAKNI